jgi:signal transduction histidine kinase
MDLSQQIQILMLEDNLADAELIGLTLREGGLRISLKRVDRKAEFVRELEKAPPQLILSDYALPTFDGLSALAIAREMCPDVPFIFVTGTMGEEVAIETLKNGATDYVLKTRLARLVPSVHRAMREACERAERKRAEAQLRESHEQLRALSAHLQRVREEERTRIAREVHDELGQALTGLKLDLSRLAGKAPRTGNSQADKIKSLVNRVNCTIQTVRRIATELRPGILDNLGLVAAIEWQAAEFESRSGLKCSVQADAEMPNLDPELNTAFFRIFQETLTNVIRHARATRLEVRLSKEADRIVLTICDNGRGISDAEISNTRSIGLRGMRERAALIGGQVSIRGSPGNGTTVIVQIPFQGAQDIAPAECLSPPRPRTSAKKTKDEVATLRKPPPSRSRRRISAHPGPARNQRRQTSPATHA